MLFDLDHFGEFNKQHGHVVGDAVLRSFGSTCRAACGRATSSPVRWRGVRRHPRWRHRRGGTARRRGDPAGSSRRFAWLGSMASRCARPCPRAARPGTGRVDARGAPRSGRCRPPDGGSAGATRWSPPDGPKDPAAGARRASRRRLGFATDAAVATQSGQVARGVTALDELTVELEPGCRAGRRERRRQEHVAAHPPGPAGADVRRRDGPWP